MSEEIAPDVFVPGANDIYDKDEMIVKSVLVSSLRPNFYNPNQQTVNDFEMLVESIKQDGFTTPVYVNDGTLDPTLKDMIIDGEHRWRAAIVLGMSHIPVVYRAANEADMRVSTLRHNEARGHHDMLMEAKLVQSLGADGLDRYQIGMYLHIDTVELDALFVRSEDFLPMNAAAQLLASEKADELQAQGLSPENAALIGGRHAMIDSSQVTSSQDGKSLGRETGKNIRIELTFADTQFALVSQALAKFTNQKDGILGLCQWWMGRSGA